VSREKLLSIHMQNNICVALLLFALAVSHLHCIEIQSINITGKSYSYGIVIDLGTKGSRIAIYNWPSDATTPYTQVSFGGDSKDPWYFKITPGIANLADPTKAGEYIKPLLDYANERIPVESQKATPLFIKGTDKIRSLPQNTSTIILETLVQNASTNYSFLLKPDFISLLPGKLEAAFMWVAVNYLQSNFESGKPSDTVGTLDMGSGSTQISFVPKSGTFMPENYYHVFVYLDTTYMIYSHSYAGYGFLTSIANINNMILKENTASGLTTQTIKNPCFLVGYSSIITIEDNSVQMLGAGSWAACQALLFEYLHTNATCNFSNCSFNGVYQPQLRGDFLADSNFYDTVHFLGLDKDASPADIVKAGITFCSISWEDALKKYQGGLCL